MNLLDQTVNPVLSAISGRRSVRAYTDRDVERSDVDLILTAAARAASGMNTQPWRVHVLIGHAKNNLADLILSERRSGMPEPEPEYRYYPACWPERELDRCRQVGWSLYGLLGIEKGDWAASRAWHDQNYKFFGAPIGMIFTLDRSLAFGSFIDLGMFLEALMVAAQSLGLATCSQAAFANYHAIIRNFLNLPDIEMVICGLALGYEDQLAVQNALRTSRDTVDHFATYHYV